MNGYLSALGIVFWTLILTPASVPSPESVGPHASCRPIPLSVYRDKLKGGFVGQMVGVCYGAPFEWGSEGVPVPDSALHDWEPKQLRGALGQDDIYVELTFLETIEKHGLEVDMEQIGRDFGESRYPLWHANERGRMNVRAGIMPPLSGHPRHNEHADDIDFQIEADIFGLIAPGMRRAAQDIAWRFGHVMNYGDGVYGGVFMSAMYSAAFFEDDRLGVVRAGLAAIPVESNYCKTIEDVVDAYKQDPDDWLAAWRVIEEKWADKLHCPDDHPLYPDKRIGIGANVNGAYVAVGFLYGHGDPVKTMRIATMCGRDTDCNAASALGILGTMIGYERLPDAFKPELQSMAGENFSYTVYDWVAALEAMERQALQTLLRQRGHVDDSSGEDVWMIPDRAPEALPLEQWPYDMPAESVPLPTLSHRRALHTAHRRP